MSHLPRPRHALRLETLESRDVPTVFTNPASIAIPDSGTGTPYPSAITVSGMGTQTATLTVTLTGMSHTFTSDIDILMVGPLGQTIVLMSDVGGSNALGNVTVTFQDGQPAMTSVAITTGTYAPTNIGVGDPFPAPAPSATPGTTLSQYVGTNPNGVWSLYVVDDLGGDVGNISGGWSIDVTTALAAPVVSGINRSSANPTNAATVTYAVTFSTAVTGVDATDFALATGGVSGASITSVTGSGTAYTVTVATGTGSGTVGLNLVDNDSILSGTTPLGGAGAGNGNFTGQVYTVDRIAPTVSSISRASANPTNAATVNYTVTFSEAVTGVDTTDFAAVGTGGVTGASVTGVTGSGTTYTVTVATGTGSGTIGLNLADDDTIGDAAGNKLGGTGAGNGDFTGQVYAIDKLAPTVQSVARASANPTAAATVTYTVTFSEAVTGVDAADFAVATSGVSGASITSVTGSGTTYTVTVATGTGDGSVRLDVNATGTGIADLTGNALSGGFAGQTYIIDKALPTVAGITRADANPTNAATVHYTVTFSEAVTGVDATDFALATGVGGASITGVSGSGTTYTVTADTGTGDGTLGLNLADDDTILDNAGNPLAGPGAGNGNFAGPAYTLDKTLPFVKSVVRADANPTAAGTVDYTVTFSEDIAGWDTTDFTPTATGVTGASVRSVALVDGVVGTYRVTVVTGTGSGTLRLDVNATGIQDFANNPLTGGYTGGETYTIDKPAPFVVNVLRSAANPAAAATVTYLVTFSTAVTGVDAADFALTATGVGGASVTGVSGSGSTRTVTVATGTGSGTLRLDVNPTGTGIQDAAGELLAGGYTAGEVYTISKVVVTPPPVPVPVPTPTPAPAPTPLPAATSHLWTTFVTGVAGGSTAGTPVTMFDTATGQTVRTFVPFARFGGAVNVAQGDLNGDGTADIVVAAGAGGGPHVKAFDGKTGAELASFFAFGRQFAGGVNLAVGDVTGDGYADIIVAAGPGGGPHVKMFDGRTFAEARSFLAYSAAFGGGVTVAAGDVNGDGRTDIVTGAGPGAGPHVRAFSGRDGSELLSFFAFGGGFAGGVSVAAGDVNGDGYADIITGAGPGAGPHVKALSGRDGSLLLSFFAFPTTFGGGVNVGVTDADKDGLADVVVGAGPGGGPHVKVFNGLSLAPLYSGFTGGTGLGGVKVG